MTREEEIKMFGRTLKEIDALSEKALSVRMLPLQIMSDCQELLEFCKEKANSNAIEVIRQNLNMAKYISDKYLVEK